MIWGPMYVPEWYLDSLGPRLSKPLVFGIRVLKYWLLGPSGNNLIVGIPCIHGLGSDPQGAVRRYSGRVASLDGYTWILLGSTNLGLTLGCYPESDFDGSVNEDDVCFLMQVQSLESIQPKGSM